MSSQENIGVVGLWHLGCVVAASWSKLGNKVRAIDFNPGLISDLLQGQPPLYEPGLQEQIQASLKNKTLSFSGQPSTLSDCTFVFLAYDTPVREDDSSDLTVLEEAIDKIGPCLSQGAILVISSQLPAGTARRFRSRLKSFNKSFELVYSPENLQLGRALECYSKPGHIVIGADSPEAGQRVANLFSPMAAECLLMNLPSAEMAKHGINSYLALSITFANQLADLCSAADADFYDVAKAMSRDLRIGRKAYLSPGVGFSGGTLGRDLKVLSGFNSKGDGTSPLFGDTWDYNKSRLKIIVRRMEGILSGLSGKTIALLGMTYKPGTSTLRRSLPLEIAQELIDQGARVQAYDPKADWSEVSAPEGLLICHQVKEALDHADLVALLTEWPEFKELDFPSLMTAMREPTIFDPKNILDQQRLSMEARGIRVVTLGRADRSTPKNIKR